MSCTNALPVITQTITVSNAVCCYSLLLSGCVQDRKVVRFATVRRTATRRDRCYISVSYVYVLQYREFYIFNAFISWIERIDSLHFAEINEERRNW
jgi:hypothetical protein